MMEVFDNWRVLHGRSEFTGIRRICGGYSKCSPPPIMRARRDLTCMLANRDDFISRWRNTNFPREEILERIIG